MEKIQNTCLKSKNIKFCKSSLKAKLFVHIRDNYCNLFNKYVIYDLANKQDHTVLRRLLFTEYHRVQCRARKKTQWPKSILLTIQLVIEKIMSITCPAMQQSGFSFNVGLQKNACGRFSRKVFILIDKIRMNDFQAGINMPS